MKFINIYYKLFEVKNKFLMINFTEIINNLHNNPIVKTQHYTDLIITPLIFLFFFIYKKVDIKLAIKYTFLTSAGIYAPIHSIVALFLYFILNYNILNS